MMGDLDALVAEAKARIGGVISKPKMTEKLLSKPPFRFLHDIVTAITSTTGFADGLYGPDELDSAAITEKNAKISYLEKIFNLVGICLVSPATKGVG
jgi:TRAF3-interacting protein 1